jgi:cyclopropane fatty-acyl-phospholipid synthase-like methyltransferase
MEENYLNNSKRFFNETPIEVWKNILSEETYMNYAFGESILNNRKIFENVTTVLDVGCGWGGSLHRIKSISPNAHITGLTESKQQSDYIGNKFDVILANANEYAIKSEYDIVTFIQSLTHMKDKAFSNLTKTTDRVFINDFLITNKDDFYLSEKWVMKIRTIDNWQKLFNENGFEIKSFNILPLQEYIKHSEFWLNNINKYNYSNITWQITVLEKLCRHFLGKKITNTEHLHPYKDDTFLVDIYAERK